MKKTILILLIAGALASCGNQRYCQPSKRSKDYADLYLKDGGEISKDYTRCQLVQVKRTMQGLRHLFVSDNGDSLYRTFQKRFVVDRCYFIKTR